MNGAIFGHLVKTLLLAVGIAYRDQVFGNLDIPTTTGDKQRGTAIPCPFDDLLANLARQAATVTF